MADGRPRENFSACFDNQAREYGANPGYGKFTSSGGTHVRPVERRMPARIVETIERQESVSYFVS